MVTFETAREVFERLLELTENEESLIAASDYDGVVAVEELKREVREAFPGVEHAMLTGSQTLVLGELLANLQRKERENQRTISEKLGEVQDGLAGVAKMRRWRDGIARTLIPKAGQTVQYEVR